MGDGMDDNGDIWGTWCRDCEKRSSCTKLCRPLGARLASRFGTRRSVAAKAFSDLSTNERLVVGHALYGEGNALDPHGRRHIQTSNPNDD